MKTSTHFTVLTFEFAPQKQERKAGWEINFTSKLRLKIPQFSWFESNFPFFRLMPGPSLHLRYYLAHEKAKKFGRIASKLIAQREEMKQSIQSESTSL